jgi:uncharacterized membrane protein YuzA (DUF378 family)
MIQKIRNALAALSLTMLFAMPALAPASVYAAEGTNQTNINNNLCSGTNFDLTGGQTTDNCKGSEQSLSGRIGTIINIFSAIVGIAAVIMIIYAGFRYVTSAGSEGGVKTAKNAIIYAIIGLVVVALAQSIVHFVINKST